MEEIQPVELTMYQELELRTFKLNVDRMSREQAQMFCMKLYEQNMVTKAIYKSMLKGEEEKP